MKEGRYRKTMIPKNKKPTKKDLLKKHKENDYHYVVLNYQRGDVFDIILNDLKDKMGGTKTAILRNALFSYNIFIQQSLKESLQKINKTRVKK